MHRLFKKFGLDDIRESVTTSNTFDHDSYGKVLRLQDSDMKVIRNEYAKGNPTDSLDSIIRDQGYDYDLSNELVYYKDCNSYKCVVDLAPYEDEKGYIVGYVIDSEGNIPKGYCATRYMIEEPLLEKDECDLCMGTHDSSANSDFLNKAFSRKYDL